MKRKPLIVLLVVCTLIVIAALLWSRRTTDPIASKNVLPGDTSLLKRLLDSAWALQSRNVDSSAVVAHRAYALAIALHRPGEAAEAINRLGNTAEALGRYDSALVWYRRALEMDSTAGLLHERARDHYQMSIVLKKKGLSVAALSQAIQALNTWNTLPGRRNDYAKACISVGNIYHRQGEYNSALNYFLKAKTIADGNTDEQLSASVSNSIGLVYEKQRLYDNAFGMYSAALSSAEHAGSLKIQAAACNNIGNIWFARGDYVKALDWYQKSLHLKETAGLRQDMSRTSGNIGLIYEALKGYDTAIRYQKMAIAEQEISGDQQSLAVSYNNLGSALSNKHQLDSAIQAFLKSVTIAQRSDMRFILLEGLNNLSEAYADKLDYTTAFQYKQEYLQVRDSLENEYRKATETDISYKEEINKRILLEKEQQKQAAEYRRQQIIVYALIAALVLLLLLFFALWKMNREKQRAIMAEQQEKLNRKKIEELIREQEIATLRTTLETQEQERKRIAKDLHDGLSLKLSTVKLYYSLLGEHDPAASGTMREQFDKGWLILDQACSELRDVAHNLESGELMKLGLVNSVRNLCETISIGAQLKVHFLAYGMDDRLDNVMEKNVYQITQELLTNILKHAQATEVSVQFNRFNHTLNLMVEDNGIGFDLSERSGHAGMGLKNIEERVGQMNGQLSIDSLPGRGTTVSIDLKVQA